MKRALIIHGWTANPQMHWFPDMINYLETLGYQVEAPLMPMRFTPTEKTWVSVIEDFAPDEHSILIGHSLGSTTILEYLETSGQKVKKVLLTGAPIRHSEQLHLTEPRTFKLYAQSVGIECLLDACGYDEIYDWEQIRQKADSFSLIYKRDDRLVPLDDGKVLAKHLNANLHVLSGYDHCDYIDPATLKRALLEGTA